MIYLITAVAFFMLIVGTIVGQESDDEKIQKVMLWFLLFWVPFVFGFLSK